MKNRPLLRFPASFAVALPLLIGGCNAEEATTNTTEQSITAEEYVQQRAAAECTRLEQCCMGFGYSTLTDCVATRTTELSEQLADPFLEFDPAGGAACVDAILRLDNACIDYGAAYDACNKRRVYRGKLSTGQACSESAQCASGSVCSNSVDGKCYPEQEGGQGAACAGTSTTEPMVNYTCAPGFSCWEGLCAYECSPPECTPDALGTPCGLAPGMSCNGETWCNSLTSSCEARVPLGDTCMLQPQDSWFQWDCVGDGVCFGGTCSDAPLEYACDVTLEEIDRDLLGGG